MTTTVTERLAVYADLARWAPSKHNTQPWRFTVYPERLDLWTDTARALTQTDPDGRERLIARSEPPSRSPAWLRAGMAAVHVWSCSPRARVGRLRG